MQANGTGTKLPPAAVATATLDALRRRKRMALPGQTRHMPPLLRLAPRTLERLVADM